MTTPLWRVSDKRTQSLLRRSKRARRGPVTVSRLISDNAPQAGASPCPRVAFVVGRCGGAVQRNRARRRLKATFAQLGNLGTDAWLVRAEPEVLSMNFEDLVDATAAAVDQLTAKAAG